MSGSRNALLGGDTSWYQPPADVTANPLLRQAPIAPPTSWASSVEANKAQVLDWLAKQQQISADRGLWTGGQAWEGGHPTEAGVTDAAKQTGEALLMGTTAPGVRAYHGSPHSFDRFDTSHIGTGEGAQAYGRGLYFAENEGVAKGYRDTLSGGTLTYEGAPLGAPGGVSLDGSIKARINQGMTPQAALKDTLETMRHMGKGSFVDEAERAWSNPDLLRYEKNPGSMYEVNIAADPEHFLHWDKTVGTHPSAVRDKLLDMGYGETDRGADVYSHLARGKEADVGASRRLRDAGIPGIRYLDQGSRAAGEGSHNLVVFDDATIEILRKYGLAGLMLGGGAAAGAGRQDQP